MGIGCQEMKNSIIRPTLKRLGLYSEALCELLLGTAAVESGLGSNLESKHHALGLYRIHPSMHQRIWDEYLDQRPTLSARVNSLSESSLYANHPHLELHSNPYYATAIAALIYISSPIDWSSVSSKTDLARIWRQYYPSTNKRDTRFFLHHYWLYLGSNYQLKIRQLSGFAVRSEAIH